MKAIFGEIKNLECHVKPSSGSYALEAETPKDVQWDHCREQFASKFNENILGFYFSHLGKKSEDVAEFLIKFESIIKINQTKNSLDFSKFCNTNKDSILWIEPSRFWVDCQIKRSLLTILLRCGINYIIEKDNFDDALFGNYKENLYIKDTRQAVLRFMFGFTRFIGNIPLSYSSTVIKHGWREEFHKLDDFDVRRRLVLPEGEDKESSIIGLEALWT